MSKTVQIIKRLRAAGLSQSEIARRTGVAQSRISRWENGAPAAAADDVLKLQALAAQFPEIADKGRASDADATESAPAPLVGEGA